MSNPNAIVQLLTVPWSSNYANLRYFDSVSSQNSWFNNRSKKAYTGMQAVRIGKKYTVKGNYNEISSYNYMRFINQQYSDSKWFYCFIDRVEYGSEDSTDIYFTIDYYQTYLGSLSFGNCFIERHHTKGDTVPKTEEPIGAGDLVYKFINNMWNNIALYICCLSSTTEGILAQLKNTGQALAEGLIMYASTRFSVINDIIKSYKDKPDEIKSIYAVPSNSCTFSGTPIDSYNISGTLNISKPSKIGGYTPKNKKCFYYPYCYAVLTNNQGSYQEFRFENCNSSTITFRAGGRLGSSPNFICQATNMKNDNDNFRPVYLNGSASVSYASDYYNGYMQRHQMDIGTQLVSGAISTAGIVAGAGTLGVGGAVAGAIGSVANTGINIVNGMNQASMQPNPTTVAGSSTPLLFDQGKYNFSVYLVRCREDYIKRVDAFFTRFGYNVQNIGKPNPTNRSSFYYCKTNGAVVKGTIPQDGRVLLENALNTGVTFWRTDDIGNYNLANN